MEQAMAELPLIFFTTLAPIGSGAFIVFAMAFFTMRFSDEQMKKLDRLTVIPLVVLAVGFGASFLHLATPAHAMNVFTNLGSSPLSNEIFVGVVFFALAGIYWIVALSGKLSLNARKGFIAVVAIAAIVFSCFIGAAYMMDTIPSWDTPYSILEVVGFCLLGGSLLGMLVLGLAGCLDGAQRGFRKIVFAIALLGTLLMVCSLVAHFTMVGSLSNSLVDGTSVTAEVTSYLVCSVVLAIVALGFEGGALLKGTSTSLMAIGLVLAAVAIFIARIVFYAMQMSVGL